MNTPITPPLLDLFQPIRAKNGNSARLLASNLAHSTYCLAVAVRDTIGLESVITVTLRGQLIEGSIETNKFDIENVPATVRCFVHRSRVTGLLHINSYAVPCLQDPCKYEYLGTREVIVTVPNGEAVGSLTPLCATYENKS